ncbi:MAG TPA: hypothetical protein VE844_22260, partial [Gammaproteobacteria bacterium]|nr:hypothetical protein [Gammaproteobacteria bacterium]
RGAGDARSGAQGIEYTAEIEWDEGSRVFGGEVGDSNPLGDIERESGLYGKAFLLPLCQYA